MANHAFMRLGSAGVCVACISCVSIPAGSYVSAIALMFAVAPNPFMSAGSAAVLLLSHSWFSEWDLTGWLAMAPWMSVLLGLKGCKYAASFGAATGAALVLGLGRWSVSGLDSPSIALLGLMAVSAAFWTVSALATYVLLAKKLWLLAASVPPALDVLRSSNPLLPLPYVRGFDLVADHLPLAQSVEWLGCFGVGWLACAISLAAAASICKTGVEMRFRVRLAMCAAMLLVTLEFLGLFRLSTLDHIGRQLTVGIVQTSFHYGHQSKPDEWDAPRRAVRAALDQLCIDGKPEGVFLAETQAAQLIMSEEHEALQNDEPQESVRGSHVMVDELSSWLADRRIPRWIVTGVHITLDRTRTYRNSVAVITSRGLEQIVDKAIPVPVIENPLDEHLHFLAPLQQMLTDSRTRIVSQNTHGELLVAPGLRIAPAICGEQMDPLVWFRRRVNPGRCECIAIFSDLGWFGFDPLERRLSQPMRRIHAIMFRRPVLMVANGGSEWWDVAGHLRASMSPNERGSIWTLTVAVPTEDLGTSVTAFVRAIVAIIIPSIGLGGLLTRRVETTATALMRMPLTASGPKIVEYARPSARSGDLEDHTGHR
jgi:hypothetical protein